jgi:threonine/homoserine/homoserine lactone efflux protein
MRSIPEFLLVALLVTLTPGPATATVVRVAARDGRRAALRAVAGVIVALDVLWYSTLSYAVDRAGTVLRPRVRRVMERVTGSVMVALGIRLAIEPR